MKEILDEEQWDPSAVELTENVSVEDIMYTWQSKLLYKGETIW